MLQILHFLFHQMKLVIQLQQLLVYAEFHLNPNIVNVAKFWISMKEICIFLWSFCELIDCDHKFQRKKWIATLRYNVYHHCVLIIAPFGCNLFFQAEFEGDTKQTATIHGTMSPQFQSELVYSIKVRDVENITAEEIEVNDKRNIHRQKKYSLVVNDYCRQRVQYGSIYGDQLDWDNSIWDGLKFT